MRFPPVLSSNFTGQQRRRQHIPQYQNKSEFPIWTSGSRIVRCCLRGYNEFVAGTHPARSRGSNGHFLHGRVLRRIPGHARRQQAGEHYPAAIGRSHRKNRSKFKKLAGRSVSRILSEARPKLRPALRGDHSSGLGIAAGLERPTRGFNGPGQPFPPIWSCSARGFPCRPDCSGRGGLLPHRFTLARAPWPISTNLRFCLESAMEASERGRSGFCGTFRDRILANPAPWRYQARCPAESGLSSHKPPERGRHAITRSARQTSL